MRARKGLHNSQVLGRVEVERHNPRDRSLMSFRRASDGTRVLSCTGPSIVVDSPQLATPQATSIHALHRVHLSSRRAPNYYCNSNFARVPSLSGIQATAESRTFVPARSRNSGTATHQRRKIPKRPKTPKIPQIPPKIPSRPPPTNPSNQLEPLNCRGVYGDKNSYPLLSLPIACKASLLCGRRFTLEEAILPESDFLASRNPSCSRVQVIRSRIGIWALDQRNGCPTHACSQASVCRPRKDDGRRAVRFEAAQSVGCR